MGEWIYRSTYSWPRHWLDVSGQYHGPAAYHPGERAPPVQTGPQSPSGRCGELKILDPAETRISTPRSPNPQPVAILTAIPRLIRRSTYGVHGFIGNKITEECIAVLSVEIGCVNSMCSLTGYNVMKQPNLMTSTTAIRQNISAT
jgi:hypothetical protein